MSWLRFLAALAALPALGAGAAFQPSVRGHGFLARAAVALGFGAVTLTLGGLALTAAGIPWSLAALAAPPVLASLVLGRLWASRPASPPTPAPPARGGTRALAAAASVAALAILGWALAGAAATSVDFLFFWGVKAARFAAHRGVDVPLLASPDFIHAVPDYPPLVPIVQAWGALAAGRLPWRAVPFSSLLWIAAAAPLLHALLRRSLGEPGAAAVSAFWTSALSASMAWAISGGNAEAPLVFFESVAVAALLTEDGVETSRFVPALMLAGAALTKVEGLVGAVCLVAGVAARDLLVRRPRALWRALALGAPALLAVGAWFGFQALEGLRVGYLGHGGFLDVSARFLPTILRSELVALDAGTYGLSWAIPLVFLVVATRRVLARVLPALFLTAGLLVFLVFDYAHDTEDPGRRIHWTAPRVTQPALSAVILAAGVASLGAAARSVRKPADRSSPR